MKLTPRIDPTDLWFDHHKIPRHKVDVQLDFGQLSPVLRWCEDCCASNYRYTPLDSNTDLYGIGPAAYRFYFKNKKDLLLFELKWA